MPGRTGWIDKAVSPTAPAIATQQARPGRSGPRAIGTMANIASTAPLVQATRHSVRMRRWTGQPRTRGWNSTAQPAALLKASSGRTASAMTNAGVWIAAATTTIAASTRAANASGQARSTSTMRRACDSTR